MGDLKNQLLKAGLVDKKQIEAVKREKKQARKKKGQKTLEAEVQAKREVQAAEAAERRREDRERELAKQAQLAAHEQLHRIAQIAESSGLEPAGRPNRRWYFEARDGRIPYVAVDDELSHKLERGSAALVESPDGKMWTVSREAAERIDQLDRSWIRCWNGGKGA